MIKHTCHWPNCSKEVPPQMWGCQKHWFTLPKFLRDQVWKEYKPGQEITKTPSERYLAVALTVQVWIEEFEKGNKMNEKEFLSFMYQRLNG